MADENNNENGAVCYAQSSRSAALTWTTLAFFAGFAGVSAFGPIVARLKESMEIGAVLMGVLSASPSLTGSLLRIPFGAVVDRMGGKKPILVLLGLAGAGIIGLALLFALFPEPAAAQFPLFLLAGILCGCGIAIFSVGIPTVSYWYPQKKQGSALAAYAGLGNLAPGLFAMLLPALVAAMGLKFSYMVWVGFVLAVFVLVMLFMKDAPYFQYREMGIEIDEDALLHTCGQELLPSGAATDSLKKAGANWRTWILTYFYFINFGGFIALTVWFPTYWAEFFEMSIMTAGFLTAAYSLSSSLLRVAGGRAADIFTGEKVVLFSFLAVIAGSILMVLVAESFALAFLGQMIMALGMGFANAAVFKLVPRYTPAAVGGASGIVGGLGAFGGFVIPPAMGLFVALSPVAGYSNGFVVFTILTVIALGLLYVLYRYPPAEGTAM
ncbi:MAG: MFS transporter [Desulfobacteraceae bacterium]|nr:MFS transporter [Desulfobacteraceae bacterium]